MKRTLVVGLLLFLCLGVAESAPRAAKEIIGVSQTWTCDATTHIGTLRIVNTSHKPITAYNVSVYLTEPDGSEFLSQSKFTPMNDPPFMPGEVKFDTEDFSGWKDANGPINPANVRVAVDLVLYDDHTAEVENQQILAMHIERHKQTADALAEVRDVVAAELATANPNHQQAIVAELKRRLTATEEQGYARFAGKKVERQPNTYYSSDGPVLDQALSELRSDTNLTDFLEVYRKRIADEKTEMNVQVVGQ